MQQRVRDWFEPCLPRVPASSALLACPPTLNSPVASDRVSFHRSCACRSDARHGFGKETTFSGMSLVRVQPVVTTTLIHGQRSDATRARSSPSSRPGSTMSVRISRTSGACSPRQARASSAVAGPAHSASASRKISAAIWRTSGSSSTTSTDGASGPPVWLLNTMLKQPR